jgi:signal transduction histidine kinase
MQMLYEFINLNRDKIIARCRGKVAVRSIPLPTESEINHGVPMFLDQLVEALRLGAVGSAEIESTASQHGHALLRQGFAVSQVVHDYGDICQSITELAIETDAPISTEDFRTLNRCLDEAIESAVTMYARERQRADSEKATDRESERLGFLVHELRNLVNTAVVAFQVLKTGNVGVGGSTGAVLDRSLISLRGLIGRSLDEIRLTNAMKNRRPIRVSTFIQEVGASATLDANARQLTFVVVPYADESVTIEVDDQVLAAVVANLLQNAFKFTRPGTTVTLRVVDSADRVLIEVHDECGGLPGAGESKELAASFEQRGADRTGVGIGLAFSRWGAEANGGRLYARNMPGKGCVFAVDLPRSLPVPATV